MSKLFLSDRILYRMESKDIEIVKKYADYYSMEDLGYVIRDYILKLFSKSYGLFFPVPRKQLARERRKEKWIKKNKLC